jgi:GTPase Era involved in 16S rRNA processing
VVVINKIDIPEVRDKLEELTKGIKAVAGHSRVLGISAATGERWATFTHIWF